jgi:hypothetical protein
LVARKLTHVERLFIRSGQSARATRLYRRRTLSLVASMIASPTLKRREYLQVKLRLLEMYRIVSSRGHDLEWLEHAYLALEELAGLIREESAPEVLLGLLHEIKGELEG